MKSALERHYQILLGIFFAESEASSDRHIFLEGRARNPHSEKLLYDLLSINYMNFLVFQILL